MPDDAVFIVRIAILKLAVESAVDLLLESNASPNPV
jgi:hypothetical protein